MRGNINNITTPQHSTTTTCPNRGGRLHCVHNSTTIQLQNHNISPAINYNTYDDRHIHTAQKQPIFPRVV